jgi:hypothetical protein
MKYPAFIDFGGSSSVWRHGDVIKVTSDKLTTCFYDFTIKSKNKSGLPAVRELSKDEISDFEFSAKEVSCSGYAIDDMEGSYRDRIFSFITDRSTIDRFRFFEMPYYNEFDEKLNESVDNWCDDRACFWYKYRNRSMCHTAVFRDEILATIEAIPRHFSKKMCPNKTVRNLLSFASSYEEPLVLDIANGNILLNEDGQAVFNDIFGVLF